MPPPFWTSSNGINKRCFDITFCCVQMRKLDKIGTKEHLQDKKLNLNKQSPPSASDRHSGVLAPYW